MVITSTSGTVGLRGATATWTAPGLASGSSVSYQAVVTAGSRTGVNAFTAAAVSTVPDPKLRSNAVASTVRVH